MSERGKRSSRGSAPLPTGLLEFVRLFNEKAFWESHEALEGPWRACRSRFYHGLILYASAFVHVERDNTHGILAQLAKTLEALAGLPDAYLGIDVEGIRENARAVRSTVARREDNPPERWWDEIDPPRLRVDVARIRGDEPELTG